MMEAGVSGTCDAVAIARKIADALKGDGFSVKIVFDAPVALVEIVSATLEVVLTTLLENGRQAAATEATIAIHATDRTEITVTENGSGIAPADRVRIFEPFFTSRRTSGGLVSACPSPGR